MRTKRFAIACFAAGALLFGSGAASASADPGEASSKSGSSDGKLSQETQAIVDDISSELRLERLKALQATGVTELNPEFAGTFVVDGWTDGQLTVRYLDTASSAERLLEIIDELNTSVPVKIVPIPTKVDVGLLKRNAETIDERLIDWFGGGAMNSFVSYAYDQLTGDAIISVSDQGELDAIQKQFGTTSFVFDGVPTDVRLLEGEPSEGFQYNRVDDTQR